MKLAVFIAYLFSFLRIKTYTCAHKLSANLFICLCMVMSIHLQIPQDSTSLQYHNIVFSADIRKKPQVNQGCDIVFYFVRYIHRVDSILLNKMCAAYKGCKERGRK